MKKRMPLLTIAIPSNNKTELLDLAINSIVSDLSNKIDYEICISDNSLNNSTEKMINEKYSLIQQISYNRTLDAPSLDENVNKVVRLSKGKYVWIFGDDDLIVEGALGKVINHLKIFNPDILILNSLSFDNSGVIENSRTILKEAKNYGPSENDKFLIELGGYMTYVGCIVINRELWNKYFRLEMVGTYFAHIDTICAVKIDRTANYISDPCIQMRLHNQTWTTKHYQIWNILYPKVIWGLNGYSEYAKSYVTPPILVNSLKAILSSRAYGRFNFKIYYEVILNNIDVNNITKLFGLIVALMPEWLLRYMYRVYIIIIKNKRQDKFSPKLALSQLKK